MKKFWLMFMLGASAPLLGAVYNDFNLSHKTSTIIINCAIPFVAALIVALIDDMHKGYLKLKETEDDDA
jgi:hypothetical protein